MISSVHLAIAISRSKLSPAKTMKLITASSSVLLAICHAASAKLGLKFNKRQSALPTLTLPYATYQAANYNADGDVCLIKTKSGQC